MERWMPKVSRAADHWGLWWVTAGVLAAAGPSTRTAARRGLQAMLLAGPPCDAVAKRMADRNRPPRFLRARHRGRVPDSGSFPSGHAAAAAAFATAVALETPIAGTLVTGLAAVVGLSRVYTGAHYPSDVAVGAAVGVAVAVGLRRRRNERS
jgi:membrane-associated phospholipid phosphatase